MSRNCEIIHRLDCVLFSACANLIVVITTKWNESYADKQSDEFKSIKPVINKIVSSFNLVVLGRWLNRIFQWRYLSTLTNKNFTINHPTANCLLQLYWKRMKVSDDVCFIEIIAAEWRHPPFYISPGYLTSRLKFGKRSLDLWTDVLVLRSANFQEFLWERFPCLKVCEFLRIFMRAFLRKLGLKIFGVKI